MPHIKQLFHTSADFVKVKNDTAPFSVGKSLRCLIEDQFSPRDNVLVTRNDFNVRVANSQESKNQVRALINQMYSWRGYRFETNIVGHHTHQTTLQAYRGEDTLGTLSLNIDSENGLLADQLYQREIDTLRKRGAALCELTCLAISKQFGSNELLASLFHLIHILGRSLHCATDAVIEINPRHSLYYQRLLGFRQIGEQTHCRRVNAPAVLLHIKTDFVEEQIAHHAGRRRISDRSLYPYFFSSLETKQLSQRILEMHHLHPAFLQKFN